MKREFSPLKLDKKTIAKLNDDQLKAVKGGKKDAIVQPGTTTDMSNCTVSCN